MASQILIDQSFVNMTYLFIHLSTFMLQLTFSIKQKLRIDVTFPNFILHKKHQQLSSSGFHKSRCFVKSIHKTKKK